MRLLIIEDERPIAEVMMLNLKRIGYQCDYAMDGEQGARMVEKQSYDLILLDRMLPEIDGLSILRSIRQNHINVPVILTTALDTVNDRIDGLDCGADDYLVKPYAIEELMARIRALSRRPGVLLEHQELHFSDLRFTPDSRTLRCQEREVQLSGREALLMEYFLRNPEMVLAREQIFARVWGSDAAVEDGNLDTYIYFLRKHLKTLHSQSAISTVHGLGYRLEG